MPVSEKVVIHLAYKSLLMWTKSDEVDRSLQSGLHESGGKQCIRKQIIPVIADKDDDDDDDGRQQLQQYHEWQWCGVGKGSFMKKVQGLFLQGH